MLREERLWDTAALTGRQEKRDPGEPRMWTNKMREKHGKLYHKSKGEHFKEEEIAYGPNAIF